MDASEVIRYQTMESICGGVSALLIIALLGWLALKAYKLYLDNTRKAQDRDIRDIYERLTKFDNRLSKHERDNLSSVRTQTQKGKV
tara:strand:+ start:650 stop:907 length:258 start_codon:yes stop_codon:yes gene_type:complete